MYFTTIQRAMCAISPDLVKCTYSLLFVNKNVSLGFIKLLCTREYLLLLNYPLTEFIIVFLSDYDFFICYFSLK